MKVHDMNSRYSSGIQTLPRMHKDPGFQRGRGGVGKTERNGELNSTHTHTHTCQTATSEPLISVTV